eukprot:CAMPEP_0115007852 /NCGR_PEP_ID=MMETSP0216-20121206/21498_1 /TAXON_ID=223996 /ORGANISM="Protocruzia adherens, Strain Boccale" /LENGTH=321 /DNA_ID=CAMNT_0002375017 /DNA_START=44 /DNA_END=1008 /DNA_ORIENTATION=+
MTSSDSILISLQEEVCAMSLLDSATTTFKTLPKNQLLHESLKTLNSPLHLQPASDETLQNFQNTTQTTLLQIARARYAAQITDLLTFNKSQMLKDIQTLICKKVSLICTRNSLTLKGKAKKSKDKPSKPKGEHDVFAKMESMKQDIKVAVETPFEVFETCCRRELRSFGISLNSFMDDGDDGHQFMEMNGVVQSMNSKFDAVAALVTVEILCETPKISATREGQANDLSAKIMEKVSSWFDGFIPEFQGAFQKRALDISQKLYWMEDPVAGNMNMGDSNHVQIFDVLLKNLSTFEPENMNKAGMVMLNDEAAKNSLEEGAW